MRALHKSVALAGCSLLGSAIIPAVVDLLLRSSRNDVVVAIYFAAISACGAVALWVVKMLGTRVPARWIGATPLLIMAVGNLWTAGLTQAVHIIVVGAVFQSVLSVPAAQLMSFRVGVGAPEELIAHATKSRIGYAVGYAAGFLLGGVGVTVVGSPTWLRLVAGAQVVLTIALFCLMTVEPQGDRGGRGDGRVDAVERKRWPWARRPRRPRWSRSTFSMFAIGIMFLSLGGDLRVAGTPLIVINEMHGSPAQLGLVLGVLPLFETMFFVLVPAAIRRMGAYRVLALGALSSIAYFLALAVVPTVAWAVAAQALFAFYVTCATGIAVGMAQAGRPDNPDGATATMFGYENLGNVIGGLLSVGLLTVAGARFAFLVTACIGGVGLILLQLHSRRSRVKM